MAKMEPIRGEITVKLSQTDRELLKTLMRGLGIDPDDKESFADVTVPKFGADNPHIRRLMERPDPAAEGDWLLETERAEAGDDVD